MQNLSHFKSIASVGHDERHSRIVMFEQVTRNDNSRHVCGIMRAGGRNHDRTTVREGTNG
jgi:hypothetical protein